MEKQSNLLSAMANEKRLEILTILQAGERSVGKLAQEVRLSQSALSQHLSVLRRENLVHTRRDAQTIYYASQSSAVAAILSALRATEHLHMGLSDPITSSEATNAVQSF